MTSTNDHIVKFQRLLRELFQFDCAELDFGIYRIMNYKRDVLKGFINETLPELVDTDLEQGILFQQDQSNKTLDESRENVIGTLGRNAIDGDGELAEAYRDTPVGKAYLEAQAAATSGRSRSAVEIDIYNHLYTFFSRYYQEGDFISKRRYSRNQRYAIPYNGEEVYLHWANRDQYYIKTAEYFHNYDWKAPNGVTVHFKLKAVNVEQDNVKGEKRFFLPVTTEIKWDDNTREVTISFEYRPLTSQEKSTYGKQNYQQDKIITSAIDAIPEQLGNTLEALAALMDEKPQNSDSEPITFLEYHLRQYTKRNTSDFFIHKDLKGFLIRELDFYLKNEVLNLDEMAATSEDSLKGWFQMMQLIKSVGSQIIDFLDQIEGFQKMLWEKRKFITETQYCITVGNIDESFHADIVACETQWIEWKALFGIDENEVDLFNSGKNKHDKRIAFLKTHPTLVLDTRHFDHNFIDRLLSSFDDLDGLTDGLLIHGENCQALNLLQECYPEQVKCIYIDPPYNTGNDGFIYRDSYRHSSWLTFIDGRLQALLPMAKNDSALFVSIDDNEVGNLINLVKGHSPSVELVTLITAQLNPRGRTLDKYLAKTHEYIGAFALFGGDNAIREIQKGEAAQSEYKDHDEKGIFRLLELRNRNPVFNRANRPNLFFPFFSGPEGGSVTLEPDSDHTIEIYPRNSRGEDGCWTWSKAKAQAQRDKLVARRVRTGAWRVFRKDYLHGEDGAVATTKAKSIWIDKEINNENGKELVGHLFGKAVFDFPKPVALIEHCVEIGMETDDGVFIDFFSGSGTSGHAILNLNRRDGGQRKFILVEMGGHFDTVLLPRIKKVTYTPEWKDGKPKRLATPEEAERSPHIIKYIRLESYEDALNNIEFDDTTEQLKLQDKIDDYLLKYMLKWETKHSQTLLNVEKLTCPFTYRLRIHVNGEIRDRMADIPETFNYLLGLNVSTRKVYENDGRYYLVYRGKTREAPGREIAVIWRETEGWTPSDFEQDRQFVAEQKLIQDVDTIYVNGDSCILNAKAVEPIFKARMFA